MDYIRYLREMVGTKPVIMVAAGVVLLNEVDEILMQRRADSGAWGLIGGLMELGETVEETARREALEETGLAVGKLELFSVFSSDELHTYPNGDQAQVVTILFTTDGVTGVLKPDAEGLELHYFALDSLPEPLFPPALPMLGAIRKRFDVAKA